MRVLHCADNLAGQPAALAAAERRLGLDSRVVTIRPNPFHRGGVEVLCDEPGFVREEIARARLFWRAVRWAEVVHFNFGSSITRRWWGHQALGSSTRTKAIAPVVGAYVRTLEMRDVSVLRRLGKGVIVTYQGDDARQGDRIEDRVFSVAREVPSGYYTPHGDRRKRWSIDRFDRGAHSILASTPDLLEFLPPRARFLPAAVDFSRLDGVAEAAPKTTAAPLSVIHAPSHRGAKGTRYVIDAIRRLADAGVPITLTLLEGLPEHEAVARYAAADVVVDQLLIGWYGVIAVEALALAKPVVCFIRDEVLEPTPSEFRNGFPIVRADPSSLEAVLRGLAMAPAAQLAAIGASGQPWARRWHDPDWLALEHLLLYRQALSKRHPMAITRRADR